LYRDPRDDLDRETALVELAINEKPSPGTSCRGARDGMETAKAALDHGARHPCSLASKTSASIQSFFAMLKARNIPYIPTLLVTERYDQVFANKRSADRH
jgi:hypothetical protein